MNKNMIWRFKEKGGDDPSADFGIYEHFNDNEVDALIREVLQNSIDAKRKDQQKVNVHFKFGYASNEFRDKYYGGALPKHLSMEDALADDDKDEFENLRHTFDDDKWKQELNYLLIEDYGTYGLEGDQTLMSARKLKPGSTEQTPESKGNRFRMFHWDWGGHKGEDTTFGGSWGYGKAALTLGSKIKTITTLSTRNKVPGSDETCSQILFGHCIISPHYNHEKEYYYFGHYCIEDENSKIPHSSTKDGNDRLDYFRNEVGSSRTDSLEDRGLSVLIPWPKDDFEFATITRSVIRNFSFALQTDLLEVKVTNYDGRFIEINKNSTESYIREKEIKWEENGINTEELLNLNTLISSEVKPLVLNLSEGEYNVTKLIENISEDVKLDWYEYFNDHNHDEIRKVKVNIPLKNKKTGIIEHGYFETTFMMSRENSNTFFQRHVIRVLDNENKSDVKSPNVIALTYIENDPDNRLHAFLRSAEGPSHMHWSTGRSRAKIWDVPTNILRFVTKFVPKFVEAFSIGRMEEPRSLGWLQFKTRGDRKKPVFPKKPKIPKELTDKSPLKASLIENGIRFNPINSKSVRIGMKISIEIAYETRKGNPFSKWEKDDFLMKDLKVISTGVENIDCNDNTLSFEVTNLDVEIDISGFSSIYERVAKNREIKEGA